MTGFSFIVCELRGGLGAIILLCVVSIVLLLILERPSAGPVAICNAQVDYDLE